jgi:hypothetical protein
MCKTTCESAPTARGRPWIKTMLVFFYKNAATTKAGSKKNIQKNGNLALHSI